LTEFFHARRWREAQLLSEPAPIFFVNLQRLGALPTVIVRKHELTMALFVKGIDLEGAMTDLDSFVVLTKLAIALCEARHHVEIPFAPMASHKMDPVTLIPSKIIALVKL
jgi:hypothetical protein